MSLKRRLFNFSQRSNVLFLALLLPCALFAADQPNAQPPTDWMPAGVEQLARNASSHTDFTFDKNMIQMSSGLIDGGDPDTRAAIAKLNGITVHLYRYAQPGMYDPRQVDAIRQQYHDSGWKHMVGTHNPNSASGTAGAPAQNAPPPPGASALNAVPLAPPGPQNHTDLFIKFQGTNVVGMVVLQTTPRNLNVVALSGDLSPIDLLHLRGHFGIPKSVGDDFAPADN
jgi:hypothetical protein